MGFNFSKIVGLAVKDASGQVSSINTVVGSAVSKFVSTSPQTQQPQNLPVVNKVELIPAVTVVPKYAYPVVKTPAVSIVPPPSPIVFGVKPGGQVKMSSLTLDSSGNSKVYASESPTTFYLGIKNVGSVPVISVPTNRQQVNYMADQAITNVGRSGQAIHDFFGNLFSSVTKRPTVPTSIPPVSQTTAGKTMTAVSKVPGLGSAYSSGGQTLRNIAYQNKSRKQRYSGKKQTQNKQVKKQTRKKSFRKTR
jgi:hypothetical protein